MPVHGDVHIPTCAYVDYIDIFLLLHTSASVSYLGPVKGSEQCSSRNPEQHTEIKKSKSLPDFIQISSI